MPLLEENKQRLLDAANQLHVDNNTQSDIVIASLSNPNNAEFINDEGSMEEYLALIALKNQVQIQIAELSSSSFVENINQFLISQVNICIEAISKTDEQTIELKKARAKVYSDLQEIMAAQLDYEKKLLESKHKTLAIATNPDNTKDLDHNQNILLRRMAIWRIMEITTVAQTIKHFEDIADELANEKSRIEKCAALIAALNALQVALDNDNNPPLDDNAEKSDPTLIHYCRVMNNEASKLAAELIANPKPDINEFDLLTKTVNETTQAVTDPLDVNVQLLNQNAKELPGHPSKIKKIVGIGLIIAGIAVGLAATVLLVGGIISSAPSFGVSLFSIPLAAYLYGVSGTLLVSGGATLFNSRRKGVSQVASRIAKDVAEKQQAAQPAQNVT